MALTPQQEQARQRHNASVGPEYQLSPHQYQTFASQGHQMGAPAAPSPYAPSSTDSMTQRREDAILQQYGLDPREVSEELRRNTLKAHADMQRMDGVGQSGGSYGGPTFAPLPTSMNQSQMMAGNMQAHNLAPGSIPANDYIEPSAYSTIGAGPSRLGATNPQQAVNDYREHLARESAQRQADTAAVLNNPYNIAYQQQQFAPKAPGVKGIDPNHPTLQQADRVAAGESLPPTRGMVLALYNDPNTPQTLKNEIRTKGWLTNPSLVDSDPTIKQQITQAYVQQVQTAQAAEGSTGASPGTGTGTGTAPQSAAEAAMAAAQAASQTFAAQSGTAPPIASPYGAATGTASQPVPGSNIYNDLLATYQSAYDQIQQGEEERRQTHQQGQAERTQAVLDRLAGLGTQEREDVNIRYDQAGSATTQSAISRGLYNTTVLDNLQRGVEQDRNRALRQVEEGLQREELGYLTQLTGDELSAYERPTAVPPDLSQLIALSQGVGAAGPVNGAGGTAAPTSQPAPAATGAASPYGGASVQPSASAQPTPSASAQPAPQAGQPAANPDDAWRQGQIERHMAMGRTQAEAERLFEIGNDPALKQKYQSASRLERKAMLNPPAATQAVVAPSATAGPQQQAGGSSPFSFSQGYQSPYAEAQAAAQPQQGVGREPMAAYPNSGNEGPSIDGNAHMRARLQQAANDRVAGAQPVAAPAPAPAAAKPPVSVPTSPYNPMTLGAPRPAQPPHSPPPGQKWMKNAKGGYQLANAAAPMW